MVEPPTDQGSREPISVGAWTANLIVVVLPPLGLVAAAVLLWGNALNVVHLGLFVGMYCVTFIGITVGFHRLFTHRSFETNRPVQFILGALGSMTVQGSLFRWVATHRRHHQHSDEVGDPHTPHQHGHQLMGLLRGIWHAHVGWLFAPEAPGLAEYVKDLRRSRLLCALNALFPLWVAFSLAIPTALGWMLDGGWAGAALGLIWGGFVRLFFVHHVTWSINSVCHLWGGRSFHLRDQSRNNVLFGIFAMGEGWHNNHHAFPMSARHGLEWWQIDVSYCVIRALGWLGLARSIRLPAAQVAYQRERTVKSITRQHSRDESA